MAETNTRMRERLSLRKPSGANPAWLSIPLVVSALFTLTVGLVAMQTVREPYAAPFFHPKGRFYHYVHRWSGRAAIVFTLPVAYHCVFKLGLVPTARVR